MAKSKNTKITSAQFRAMAVSKPKRNKYGAVKTEDGFDSKLEKRHYERLLVRLKAGEISDLERQVSFILQDKFRDNEGAAVRAIIYKADFYYHEDGKVIVEDAKGILAQHSALKIKMFKYRYRHIIFRLVKK